MLAALFGCLLIVDIGLAEPAPAIPSPPRQCLGLSGSRKLIQLVQVAVTFSGRQSVSLHTFLYPMQNPLCMGTPLMT